MDVKERDLAQRLGLGGVHARQKVVSCKWRCASKDFRVLESEGKGKCWE